MKDQTYEEFMDEIEKMCQELMAEKKAQREAAGVTEDERVITPSMPYIPLYASHYEYLHAYDLDVAESSSGAKYDTCRWRYRENTEPYPWDKCCYEDWAN